MLQASSDRRGLLCSSGVNQIWCILAIGCTGHKHLELSAPNDERTAEVSKNGE
jgi:hypothetical protein